MSLDINVRYFAAIREAIGHSQESLQTRAATVADLRAELIARGEPYASALAPGRALRCALNQQMCAEATPLQAGAEVAFFPPVTGG